MPAALIDDVETPHSTHTKRASVSEVKTSFIRRTAGRKSFADDFDGEMFPTLSG